MNIVPVILCGGSGTRLWPYSRDQYPKQFLPLTGKKTLFQDTLVRTSKIYPDKNKIKKHIIVTNEEHRFLAKEQSEEVGFDSVMLLEPIAKNTAPALTIAALQAIEEHNDAILVVTPADHYIDSEIEYVNSIGSAIERAIEKNIVVLGITPTLPETGYGYIKINQITNSNFFEVNDFKEKPSLEMAKKYIKSGDYFWNSGMFVVDANIWLDAIKKLDSSIYESSKISWQNKKLDGIFVRPNKEYFDKILPNSIDYSVMEKSIEAGYKVEMVPLDVGWDDLGSWSSVKKYMDVDNNNNYVNTENYLVNSNNNMIHSTSKRLLTTLNIENICIVDTPDALMVASMDETQNVKQIVNQLKSDNKIEATINRKTYRPWGWYDNIEESNGFKVKRIGVNPGAVLSLQKHHRRSEHWVVIKGTAEVTCGKKVFDLNKNESTFIPLGEKHRLKNNTKNPLEIIEVQLGDYLEEDDIVRFEDTYGRTSND